MEQKENNSQSSIKEQSELEKYKKNLHNLVVAYKKLTLEKKALEDTLKASSNYDREDASETDTSEVSNDSQQSRFINLVNTIASLQREKNEAEEIAADEKQHLQDKIFELEKLVKELNNKMDTLKKLQRLEMENIKAKFNKERLQREKEFNDHGVMMRELQKLMAEERRQKEQAESLADSLQKEIVHVHRENENLKKSTQDMEVELKDIKQKLKYREEETSGMLSQLRHEVKAVRQNHSIAIAQEQQRATDAENRARELAISHEVRVSNLETRLTELSNSICVYDKIRHQDELTIQSLKEQINKLEIENENENESENNEEYTVSEIVEKFKHFKTLLLNLAKTSEVPLNIEDLILKDFDFDIYDYKMKHIEHSDQQDENNLSSKQDNSVLLNQVKSLKQHVNTLQLEQDQLERKYKEKLEDNEENNSWKEKYMANDLEWRKRTSILEQQLLKQRDKAQELVLEKELELNTLRETLHSTKYNRKTSHSSTGSRKEFQEYLDEESSKKGSHLLHYAHELALKDMEISKFRKSKSKIESKYRDLQKSTADMQQQYKADIDKLNQQLVRLESCKSREGANLEYLKNVTLSYFLTADDKIRKHMVNAIAAVLKFSDSEAEKAIKSLSQGK
ncbi:GRIP and coiled-coil domain-containing protein 1 isoform X1 [Rhopalosiphum maidis]|uniref:GRIP and coiled-coil domain-containing protein 1 isoform X1 n=1 Tax=Rhopalosiphum maidis TaxID=43146 RepID=UPI000EFEB733|nr:GRIP and coiled-coil domain-containing protein 1 isoform X1 [Rhopalosiphum maidis]